MIAHVHCQTKKNYTKSRNALEIGVHFGYTKTNIYSKSGHNFNEPDGHLVFVFQTHTE